MKRGQSGFIRDDSESDSLSPRQLGMGNRRYDIDEYPANRNSRNRGRKPRCKNHRRNSVKHHLADSEA
jgi:hypothetical protein